MFPSLVLSQIVDALDNGLVLGPDDDPSDTHSSIVKLIKNSSDNRQKAPTDDFVVLHGLRFSSGMSTGFRLWTLTYNAARKTWEDSEVVVPTDQSGLVCAFGSGASVLKSEVQSILKTPQGQTSRAVFWSFCDALESNVDPLTGGAPQLVGIYRKDAAQSFGIVYDGENYFQGMRLNPDVRSEDIEWRDRDFQRVNKDGTIVPGGQRQVRK